MMVNVSSSNGQKANVPKLRFPGFEEPWKMVFLQDISEYRKGKISVSKSKYISTENMLQNFSGIIPYVTKEEIIGVEFNAGDTLLANIRPYLKKAWLAAYNGACSSDVLALCPLDVTPDFLNNIIEQDRFIDYVMSGVKGSKMPRGDKSHILAYETAIPSELEQEKINSFIQLMRIRIEKIQMEIELLKKYKRGLLNKVFSNIDGKIYPTVYLSEVADFLQGLTYSPRDVADSGYLVLRSSNIQNGMLSFEDCVYVNKKVTESLQVKCDDVIMCVRNGSKNLVGKTALISNDMPMITWGAFMMIIRSKLNDTYVFHYLNSQMFFSQVFKDTGTATINQITKGILNECKLPLPPKEIRKKISKVLSSFDVKIQNAERCLVALLEERKALLQQLFI